MPNYFPVHILANEGELPPETEYDRQDQVIVSPLSIISKVVPLLVNDNENEVPFPSFETGTLSMFGGARDDLRLTPFPDLQILIHKG